MIVIESDEEETSIVQKISGTSKIVASTRLPSSPVSIANQEPEKTMNDSIVDSSFSFLMDNLVTTIRNGGPKLSSSKPVSQPVSAGRDYHLAQTLFLVVLKCTVCEMAF